MSDRLDRALAKLRELATVNAPHGSRINAEEEYGNAYRELVKAGLRPKLRAKYRQGGRHP